MNGKRRIKRSMSLYNKQVLQIIEKYVAKTGNHDWQMIDVARWAIAHDEWTPPRYDPARHLARDLSRAARQEYLEDENGEPVRRKHRYSYRVGDRYQTTWFNIESTTPEKVRLSLQQRRRGVAADVFQAERDLRYYNKNFNPGDPIQISWNIDIDIAEKDQPSEYDDTPPSDSDE